MSVPGRREDIVEASATLLEQIDGDRLAAARGLALDVEETLCRRALERNAWNLTHAAVELGHDTPTTLQSLLRRRHPGLDEERKRRAR
jgi:transcriptional regulator with GAF, ATPase, and Fis domain